MTKTTNSWIFSAAERQILELALQNPELSNSEIADRTESRISLVRDTRQEYEDDVELPDDIVTEPADEDSTVDLDDDLSEVEQVILELVAENPQITNAEIAEKTGARVALIRDTRDSYGDQVKTQPDDTAASESESRPSGPGEPSAAQQEILDVAASDPTLSNADIADQTDERVTLVRDTLDQYDGPSDTASTAGVDAEAATETVAEDDTDIDIDTERFTATQVDVLEAAAANPDATNRELADQTGSRLTLVRDTLAAQQADDSQTVDGSDSGPESESDDSVGLPDDVDSDEFSGTQLDILSVALNAPELTNAEVAAETGTRITLVRDTLWQYEHDENPYAGSVDDGTESEADDDDDDEAIVDIDNEIEIPDTTASDVFNDRQRAILEAALENPELTNSEIADQTGARLTLVRDTRSTYEADVELADSDDGETTTTPSTSSPDEPTFSEKQQQIIAAADANQEATIAEIASETNSRITLVRDTLAAAEDHDVDATVADDSTVNDDLEADDTVADDLSVDDDGSSTTDTSQDDADDDEGISDELLVAIIIAIILHFAIIAMLI